MTREFFAILFAVLFGMAFSQVPVFVQEYEQRLGGAVGELVSLADAYADNANRSDLTLEAYINRHLSNRDQALQKTGATMRRTLTRLGDLEAGKQALDLAPRWQKPWALIRHNDRDLLIGAWDKFRFTLAVDPVFGAVGLLVGFLFNRVLVLLLRPRRDRWAL